MAGTRGQQYIMPQTDLMEIPVFQAKQGAYTFYVGVFSAKKLLSVAYVQHREGGEGVQRILSGDRLREIADYIRSTERPGLLPNAIILGLKKNATYNAKHRTIRIPDRPEQAFVIDGQHRLFAFLPEYAGDFDMEIPFTAFIDLDMTAVAYLFRTINSTQRKINPSLVFDLIPYLREKNWAEFEDSRAQYLVQAMNDEENSPWYHGIAMLGGREAPITQASFVTAIKAQLKKGRSLSSGFMDGAFAAQEIQYELLRRYFRAIADAFPGEWLNRDYIVCKNLGVSAFLNILGDLIQAISDDAENLFSGYHMTLEPDSFRPYLTKIRKSRSWHRSKMAQTYLGAAGIRRLTEEMRAAAGIKAP